MAPLQLKADQIRTTQVRKEMNEAQVLGMQTLMAGEPSFSTFHNTGAGGTWQRNGWRGHLKVL